MKPEPSYVAERRSLRRRRIARGLVGALTLAIAAIWLLRANSSAEGRFRLHDPGPTADPSSPAAPESKPSLPVEASRRSVSAYR